MVLHLAESLAAAGDQDHAYAVASAVMPAMNDLTSTRVKHSRGPLHHAASTATTFEIDRAGRADTSVPTDVHGARANP